MAEPTSPRIPDDYPDEYFDCRLDRHSWDSPRGRTIPLTARPTVAGEPAGGVTGRPRNAEWRRDWVERADVKLYDPDRDPDFEH